MAVYTAVGIKSSTCQVKVNRLMLCCILHTSYFWPVKIVSYIAYTVLAGTLNHAQSTNQSYFTTE